MYALGVKNLSAGSRDLRQVSRKHRSGLLGVISFYGLLCTIFLAAIPYGTVEVWHKSLFVLAICVVGGFRLADCAVRGTFKFAEPSVLLPLVGILGLALVQVVPLPGVPAVVSVDPYETRSFAVVFGALLIAVELLFYYVSGEYRIKFLVGLVITVGLGSALFGILREFYLDASPSLLAGYFEPGQGYAQFINRNHFAFLIEMAFGLLLGLLIKGENSEKFKFFGWVISGVLIYSVITANSRGGLLGLGALSLFAVAVHMVTLSGHLASDEEDPDRSPRRAWCSFRGIALATVFCGLVFGLIVVTVAFVGGDEVVTRIERLRGEVETVSNSGINRRLIWNSTLDLVKENPILGVGFGGYAAAIPAFDASGGRSTLQQAHNDYLEILANGGLIGFALFAAFGVLIARRTAKNLRSIDPFRRSSAFGAAIGIFGVLIHSFVDFGLHVMVNALILAVLIVIACGRTHVRWSERSSLPFSDSAV